MENWEEDLLNQVGGKKAEEPSKEIPFDNKTKIILGAILFLTLAIFLALEYKSAGGSFKSWVQSRFQKKNVVLDQPSKVQIEEQIDIKDLISKITALEAKNKELENQLLWNSQRIGLMGIMLNENFMLLKNNLSKDGLIFLGRDWKISQMPKNLKLTDEDKEILKQFLETPQ